MNHAPPQSAERRDRPSSGMFADACYVALRLIAWLAVSLACVAAFWALFFVMLGNFTFIGFALHLDNFAARYIAADAARQTGFRTEFWAASGVLFLLVTYFRRHALARLKPTSKEIAHGEDKAAGG